MVRRHQFHSIRVKTLLWALNHVLQVVRKGDAKELDLTIYTDSQNIVGLPARRARLEHNDYISRNKKELRNAELYREFYQLSDRLPYTLVKVKGHKVSRDKNQIDRLFSVVDQAARCGLRDIKKAIPIN